MIDCNDDTWSEVTQPNSAEILPDTRRQAQKYKTVQYWQKCSGVAISINRTQSAIEAIISGSEELA